MDSCDCRSQFFDACWNNSASGNCFAVSGQFVRATGGIKYSKKCGRCGFLASVFTFLAQLVKGLIEYKTAAKARSTMRKTIFSKVMELDAGGIEKIGPTSAITAAVDAVEQMPGVF